MTRILLIEGNSRQRNRDVAERGVRSGSGVYIDAIWAHFPDLNIDIIHAADRSETLPEGRALDTYDGLVIGGSSLHAYDNSFEVTQQIELVKAFAQTGAPILGSCWGLQIAVMAAGGQVAKSVNGREVCFARKIEKTDAGREHPFLAGKPKIYDAPCIHYDEITRLPESAVILSGNTHSPIRAATFRLGKSEVWAVQYHPEFDLGHLAGLLNLIKDDMFEQQFFENEAAFAQYQSAIEGLGESPDNRALAWQLGIDTDVTNEHIRRAEIINWIKQL